MQLQLLYSTGMMKCSYSQLSLQLPSEDVTLHPSAPGQVTRTSVQSKYLPCGLKVTSRPSQIVNNAQSAGRTHACLSEFSYYCDLIQLQPNPWEIPKKGDSRCKYTLYSTGRDFPAFPESLADKYNPRLITA